MNRKKKPVQDDSLVPGAPPASASPPMTERGAVTKVKNNLVALGSVAVFTVYAAGYERTQAAADRFANDADDRRPPLPVVRTIPGRPAASTPASVSQAASNSPAPERHAEAVQAKPGPTPSSESRAPTEPPSATNRHADSTQTASSAPVPVSPATTNPAPTPTPAPSQAPVAPTAAAPAPAAPTDSSNKAAAADSSDKDRVGYKDGTYTGWGTSRHGDIQATVMIKNGRITFAAISECLTQYSCSWISALPPQVVSRQSAEVDYVSGATQSTRAFYYAIIEALAKAK